MPAVNFDHYDTLVEIGTVLVLFVALCTVRCARRGLTTFFWLVVTYMLMLMLMLVLMLAYMLVLVLATLLVLVVLGSCSSSSSSSSSSCSGQVQHPGCPSGA